MSSRFIIYGLTDPRTGEVRYIGKSSTGMKRPRNHMLSSKLKKDRSHKANWIRELLSAGHIYDIVVLERAEAASQLDEAERRWIAHGRAQGWPLTNLTEGGDGGATRTGVPNGPETRGKMSAAKKGVPARPHVAEMLRVAFKGRKHSAETLEKMRAAKIGRVVSAETRKKMSIARTGTRASAETRAKLSASRRRRIVSEETGRRISAALAGKPRPYVAERNRKMKWTEEMRAKARAARKNGPVNGKVIYVSDDNGTKKTIAEWARMHGVPYPRLRYRIVDLGWSLEKSINQPTRGGDSKRRTQLVSNLMNEKEG